MGVTTMPKNGLEERVILCLEAFGDVAQTVSLLSGMGVEGISCENISELCDQMERGAAAIILTDTPEIWAANSRFLSILHDQPHWSSIPTIIITNELESEDVPPESLPTSVTLIERPVRKGMLVSLVRSALHARGNQYRVRDLLNERQSLVEMLRNEATLKNEFLATLAHELRNPLAPIRTGLQVLRLSVSKEDSARTLDMMERQVRHMVRLIDDLLDISRISRGKLNLRKEKVSLSSLVENAVESSKPFIEAGHHTLNISLPQKAVSLDADPTRIAQVISNLLNNAAKYTPNGGTITLTAGCTDNSVRIEIRDTGIGLSPEMLTKIFDMFSQVDPLLVRSQGGLGIGLTLARRLTEMHNGTVEATSAGLGKGSTFIVNLPCTQTKEGEMIAPVQTQVSQSKSHRVLIVDDKVDVAQSLEDLLGLLGQETRTAYTGPDALTAAKDFNPELIFLDIGLPGMTGYEVARQIRAQETSPRPVLIAVTGWGGEQDISLARAAGFDRHLTKPVDPQEVEKIVKEMSEATFKRPGARSTAAPPVSDGRDRGV